MSTVSETQREQLSAYLDGMLPEAERRQLEQLLQSDAGLAAELRDLQTTAALLRDLPPVRPPRSFTLDPATVAPRRRTFGFAWTRWAAVVGALALFLTVGLGALTGGPMTPSSAPARSNMGSADSSGGNAEAAPTTAPAAEDAAAGAAMPAPAMESQAVPSQEPPAEPFGAAGANMGVTTISGTLEAPVAGGAPMDMQRSTITMTYGAPLTESQAADAVPGRDFSIITDSAGVAKQSPVGLVAPELGSTDTSSPDTRDFMAAPPAFLPDADSVQAAAPADESPNLGLLFGLLTLAGLLGALALTAAARRADRRD